MGLFDHFPYTNVHELNLDWILSMMKALEAEWEAFTAGNSLTFADPLQHDISKTYAKNTIVLDGTGNAYVSLQAVPVGVGLQNGDYWLMVFDYEAFIEKVNKNFTARYYRGSYRASAAMAIGDWLTVDDVLYKATAAIAVDDVLEDGVNITHFTVEDFIKAFMLSANQLIQQYKNDIDASELLYRQQLAQDIANTTASLQAQLDLAISGATVDSEVINARLGVDGVTYPTLGAAIRTQFTNRTIEFLHVNVSSSSDPYADLNDVPVNSYITYETGEAYLLNKPDGADYHVSVMTLSAYHPNYTGALQICTGFDRRTATMHPRVFTRLIWGGAGNYTYSTWNELLDDNDAVARDFTKIEGSLLANDSPYLDLNTFPVNRYACYNNPVQTIQNTPSGETAGAFNVFSFKAYPTEAGTAITQLIFYPNSGHTYVRSNFANTWYPWMRLDNSEVIDARLGADGVTYPTLGDAIRTQLQTMTLQFIHANVSSSSDTYADFNDAPVNSYITYETGEAYLLNKPDGADYHVNLITLSGYRPNYTGAFQICTGFDRRTATMHPRVFTRLIWGGAGNYTYSTWNELLNDNDAVARDFTKIEGSLLANDSPYLDLNTFPVNRYACYNSPVQGVQNTPEERYNIFNIVSFKAYPTESGTAITQLIFYPNNGHIYTRSNFGNIWYPWRRVDNADESIRKYSYHDILPVNMNINSSTKMIFSGDSITANPTGYVSNLASILGCNVVNIGVNRSCYTSDDTSTSILEKLQTVNLTCDYLVIAGGTNDYGVTQATDSAFKTALTNTFDYVDNNSTGQVIIMLPINRCTTAPNASGLYLSDYRQMLYEEAVRRNYWVIDCDSFFPNTSGTWQNEILPDKLHPSAVGARMYAESIATKLKY